MTQNEITHPRLVRVIAVLVSIVLFLTISELTLRLLDPDLFFQNQFFPLNRDMDFPQVYNKDHDLFWKFRQDITTESKEFSYLSYHIDKDGFRGDEVLDQKPDLRLLSLGNSCTFGWGVEHDQIFTEQLEKILANQRPGKTVEVINAGVPGYSSYQGLKYYADDLIKYHADIVLIMFGWNDQWTAGGNISDADQQLPPQWVLSLRNVMTRTRLYQLMRKILLSLSEPDGKVEAYHTGGVHRVSTKEFNANLKKIIKLVKENGSQPILLIPPIASLTNYFEPGTVSEFHSRHAYYQREVVLAGQYTRTPVVDLQTAFDKYRNLFNDVQADAIHFNHLGHRTAAEVIAVTIDSILNTKE